MWLHTGPRVVHCFFCCWWRRVFSPSQQLFLPCLCTVGHSFPCAAHRCEAGGSFLHLPEMPAAVTTNENNSTGFPLLFILPLSSVHPPHFPCATSSSTPSRSLSQEAVHLPPQGHDVNQELFPPQCCLASKYAPFPLLVQSTALQ